MIIKREKKRKTIHQIQMPHKTTILNLKAMNKTIKGKKRELKKKGEVGAF